MLLDQALIDSFEQLGESQCRSRYERFLTTIESSNFSSRCFYFHSQTGRVSLLSR